MKSFNKLIVFMLLAIYVTLLCLMVLTAYSSPKYETDNEIRYEIVERFGNIDEDGTLFIAEDGNMYAVDEQYQNITENRFMLCMDGKGTESKTDDEILEVWVIPTSERNSTADSIVGVSE